MVAVGLTRHPTYDNHLAILRTEGSPLPPSTTTLGVGNPKTHSKGSRGPKEVRLGGIVAGHSKGEVRERSTILREPHMRS
jgi:hypothetical protein